MAIGGGTAMETGSSYLNYKNMPIEIIEKLILSSRPECLKEMILGTGKAVIEVDKLSNDYTRTCKKGELLIVEPGRPPISATKRYVVWYGKKLIYCKIMRTKNNTKWNILGIGEIDVCDIKFWCNAKKL